MKLTVRLRVRLVDTLETIRMKRSKNEIQVTSLFSISRVFATLASDQTFGKRSGKRGKLISLNVRIMQLYFRESESIFTLCRAKRKFLLETVLQKRTLILFLKSLLTM